MIMDDRALYTLVSEWPVMCRVGR